MKTTITTLALVLGAMTASAQSFDYTASPAPGVVSELTAVEVIFSDWAEIEINSKDDITVSLDGTQVDGVRVNQDANVLTFVFDEKQTAPGQYTLSIPAWSIGGLTYDEAGEINGYGDLEENIAIEYIIEAGSSDTPKFTYTADPEQGVVTELSAVTLAFPEFGEIEIAVKDDIAVTYNGSPVEGMKIGNSSYGSNDILFTFPETMTAPGEYAILIPAYSISGYTYDEEGEVNGYGDLTEDINVVYTINVPAGSLDFSYDTDPAADVIVSVLSKVALTFSKLDKVAADKAKVEVKVDGTALAADAYDVVGSDVPEEMNLVNVLFEPEITSGNVEITFGAGALSGVSGETEGVNEMEFVLSYTVASPVVYDLTLELANSTKPNADGEISAEKQLTAFFFAADQAGLLAGDGTEPNVTIREVNGDYERTAVLKKGFGNDAAKTYFSADFGSEPSYNGEYVVTIAKGAFGDAIWAENHEYGHSNDAIELRFTLIDGQDRNVYDIEPVSVTPAAGKVSAPQLAEVKVVFPEGVAPKGDAYATLAGVTVSYLETAVFKANEDGSYTAVFENIPTELGSYLFNVVAGQFGDEAYVAGGNGHGNAEINVEYNVDSLTGISGVGAETISEGVYDLNGVKVSDTVDNLPAGVYVSGGRKIVVK